MNLQIEEHEYAKIVIRRKDIIIGLAERYGVRYANALYLLRRELKKKNARKTNGNDKTAF